MARTADVNVSARSENNTEIVAILEKDAVVAIHIE